MMAQVPLSLVSKLTDKSGPHTTFRFFRVFRGSKIIKTDTKKASATGAGAFWCCSVIGGMCVVWLSESLFLAFLLSLDCSHDYCGDDGQDDDAEDDV